MNKRSWFLIIAAIGLTPIALSYGLVPSRSLSVLFGIDGSAVNTAHIFRAIMGLYLALIVFWVSGALYERMHEAALWSLTVFMLGLAAGRALSLLIDGIPNPLLLIYLVLEIGFGLIGFHFARQARKA